MVAVVIVALVMTATLTLLIFSRIDNALEQERTRAHQVVTQEMERVAHELYTRVTGGRQVLVWDNGTPNDLTDDTMGTLEVIIRNPQTGAQLFAAPVPAIRIQVEATLTWQARGSMARKTMRETVMTYIAP
jgi:hypothetical protein